jgi:hypothetical protein
MEFEVNGRNYRSAKMDAMTQFNVIRRLAPIMEPLGEFIKAGAPKPNGEMNKENAMVMAMPIIKAIAELPEETTDFVISTCMSLVRRSEGQDRGWAPVWNVQAHRPQMDDIDMVTMLQIVVNVLGGSFERFFPGRDWSSETRADRPSILNQ